jgi:hypothetical protein
MWIKKSHHFGAGRSRKCRMSGREALDRKHQFALDDAPATVIFLHSVENSNPLEHSQVRSKDWLGIATEYRVSFLARMSCRYAAAA